MKTTQSVLPAATRKTCRAQEISSQIKEKLSELFKNGFFYCFDCEARCERVEGEQGQPDHCDKCGSHRIRWNAPAWSESITVGDTHLIHPREL